MSWVADTASACLFDLEVPRVCTGPGVKWDFLSYEMCTQDSITDFAAVLVVSKVPSRDIKSCLPLVKFPEDAVMGL